jgi:hypothetical protein
MAGVMSPGWDRPCPQTGIRAADVAALIQPLPYVVVAVSDRAPDAGERNPPERPIPPVVGDCARVHPEQVRELLCGQMLHRLPSANASTLALVIRQWPRMPPRRRPWSLPPASRRFTVSVEHPSASAASFDDNRRGDSSISGVSGLSWISRSMPVTIRGVLRGFKGFASVFYRVASFCGDYLTFVRLCRIVA